MLTRLSLLVRQGSCLSRLVLSQARPIPYRTMTHEQSSPPRKEPPRANYSPSEMSEMVLRRLQFRNQRGVVRALIIGSGIVVVSSVLFVYVFRTPLKNQTVAQVADVAKSSLEQGNSTSVEQREIAGNAHRSIYVDSVKQQVNLLSQELIQNLLSDSNILSKALLFLERVMDDPSTKQTLIRLLQRLMTDADMQRYVSEFTSRIIYDVMKRPETEIQLAQLFRRAILQKDNQDALYILVKEFIDNEKTKVMVTQLALDVSHRVLHDEGVRVAATIFAKDILNDTGLQQQSGDFAWSAMKNDGILEIRRYARLVGLLDVAVARH